MTDEEINQLILDSYELGQRVLRIQKLLDSLKNPKVRDNYNQQVYDLIEDFNIMCDLLKKELLARIELEKENKIPINLSYRKILKNL